MKIAEIVVSYSRRVSTAQYETAEVFASEKLASDVLDTSGSKDLDVLQRERTMALARIRTLVDTIADSLRGKDR